MLFREQSRPFDPTGNAPLNLILAEHHPLAVPNDRIFIPSHGPYYTKSLTVTNGGTPLVRGTDYECILFYKEATLATGKEVGVGIRIIKTGITEIRIDYQVVGGQFQFVFPVLKQLMDSLGDELINPILYNDIIDKPEVFPPAAHRHPYWQFEGWDLLLTPLDRILNGIYYQDRSKYRSTYDYWYTKLAQFDIGFDFKIQQMTTTISQTQWAIREPIGTVRLRNSNRDMGLDREGVWETVNDRILAFTDVPGDTGHEFTLSEEIVYPQPDNILLDEQSNPILDDSKEWIYLDNEFPIIPAPTGDYDEEVDEQFDLFLIRGYVKTLYDDVYNAYVSVDRTTPMVEGDSVTFTLHTNKFDRGLVVPYRITGVNTTNISIPTLGEVTLGADGTASVTLTLLPNGPRTDSDRLTIEFLVNGGTTKNIDYSIPANATYRLKALAVTGINDIKVPEYTLGDTFMLCLSQHGLSGKVVRMNVAFDGTGSHQIRLNNIAPTNGYVEFVMPANGTDLYISVACTPTSLAAVSSLNFNFSYNSVVLDTFTLPASQLDWHIEWCELSTNEVITEVLDEVPFTLKVIHSSKKPLTFAVGVTENTLGSEVSTIPVNVISNYHGEASAGRLMVGRNNRQDIDRLSVLVRNPYIATDTRTITLAIPAVA